MAGRTTVKPYKLTPSGDSLSRDDLATWRQILLGHMRQNEKWLQFMPSSATNHTWTCTDDDETNNLFVMTIATQDTPAIVKKEETNTLRADFQNFLTCLATYAPPGFSETIYRESTSFTWVIELINATYGLDAKGEHFLALDKGSFPIEKAAKLGN